MSRVTLWLIISVALLFSMGLLMVFNTTAAEIIDRSLETSTHAALFKQIFYGCVGIGCGSVLYWMGHERVIRYSVPLMALTTCLLVLVFVPGIGQSINGARRWLNVFGFSFQPSECVKILLPAVYIHWFLKQKGPVSFPTFLKMIGVLSIPIGLILFEPDNGTTAILLFLFVMLFLLTRIRLAYWALPLSGLIVLGGIAASQMPHVPDRIRIYLHPEQDLRGKGHQPYQAKIAAGSGGVLGRGLGESLQKLNYLPEARNDYIAAIYAEEMGFVGILVLIALYLSVCFSGVLIAIRARKKESFLLAATLTILISIQAFLNLGIVSGLLPSKGMTLPYFSQGGTSLMVNMIILFILLDVARKAKKGVEYGA